MTPGVAIVVTNGTEASVIKLGIRILDGNYRTHTCFHFKNGMSERCHWIHHQYVPNWLAILAQLVTTLE